MSAAAETGAGIDLVRLRRAVHLDVERDGAVWVVTGGAGRHFVTRKGVRLHCACTDASVRPVNCKHVLAVALHLGNGKVIRALREIVEPKAPE